MKKIFSLVLCLIMLVSTSIPAMAAPSNVDSKTVKFTTSNTGYLEITYNNNHISKSNETDQIESFIIKQFEYNNLVQTVEGKPGGSELIVTDWKDDKIVSSKTVQVSDIITKNTNTNSLQPLATTSVGSQIGYITYKLTTNATTSERIRVYSDLTDSDDESYTIRGKETDTLATIVGAIASVISLFIPAATVPRQIAIAIISAFGGSIAGGAIGVAFSESVSVHAEHYTLTGYDYSTNRYTQGYEGIKRRVQTKKSSSYNEVFYDGFTPDNWKDNALAYWFWCDLFGDPYPGVKSYT